MPSQPRRAAGCAHNCGPMSRRVIGRTRIFQEFEEPIRSSALPTGVQRIVTWFVAQRLPLGGGMAGNGGVAPRRVSAVTRRREAVPGPCALRRGGRSVPPRGRRVPAGAPTTRSAELRPPEAHAHACEGAGAPGAAGRAEVPHARPGAPRPGPAPLGVPGVGGQGTYPQGGHPPGSHVLQATGPGWVDAPPARRLQGVPRRRRRYGSVDGEARVGADAPAMAPPPQH